MTFDRHRLPLLATAMVAVIATSLTACGGGDKAATGAAPGSPERPLVAEVPEPTAAPTTTPREPSASATHAARRRTRSNTHAARASRHAAPAGEPAQTQKPRPSHAAVPQTGGRPNYQQLLANQTSHPSNRFSPCNLVTATEARMIVGAPMQEPVEAPQGPTCVYRTQSGKNLIALAVQTTSFARIKPQIHNRRQVAVSGHTAFCGIYGQPMLYVPLTRGRVLSISAPCATAKNFALRALPHL